MEFSGKFLTLIWKSVKSSRFQGWVFGKEKKSVIDFQTIGNCKTEVFKSTLFNASLIRSIELATIFVFTTFVLNFTYLLNCVIDFQCNSFQFAQWSKTSWLLFQNWTEIVIRKNFTKRHQRNANQCSSSPYVDNQQLLRTANATHIPNGISVSNFPIVLLSLHLVGFQSRESSVLFLCCRVSSSLV